MRRRSIELDVRPFGQPEAQCGNTSLRTVCWYHGLRRHPTIRELARLAHATSDGIDHADLVRAACKIGATVFSKSGGKLAELRWFLDQGLPAIIGWWSMDAGDLPFDPRWTLAERRLRDCGHFSVVAGMTDHTVRIVDPQWHQQKNGRLAVVGNVDVPRARFLGTWYDTDTSAFKLEKRWYMIVNFTGTRFADRIRGGRDHAPIRSSAASSRVPARS
jgi:hypothetical protein